MMRGLFVAFLLGCLLPLGLAPFNLWWLSMLSVGLFPFILGHKSGFLRGWAYGAGVYIFGVSWVYVSLANYTTAGPLSAGLATALLGIILGLFFACLGWVHHRFPIGWRTPLLSTVLWVGFEWVRSWIFTGFPWLYLGYTGLTSWLVSHWIPVVGIYGSSFLIGLWSILAVAIGLQSAAKKSAYAAKLVRNTAFTSTWLSCSILIAIPLANLVFSQFEWTTATDQSLKFALIQGNIEQGDKWDSEKAAMINGNYLNLSKQALQQNADIIVWPEAAVPHLYSEATDVLEAARQAMVNSIQNQNQTPSLITGILTDTPNETKDDLAIIRNSVLLLTTTKTNDVLYHKQKLVPFGEYLPFAEQLISVMPFLSAFRHGITKGPEQQASLATHNWLIQPLICYEIAFPALAHKEAWQGNQMVDAILTISNDGWFGNSHGPEQHFQMAQFRAKELGRPVIRATNNGITGVINSQGQVQQRLAKQTRQSLIVDVAKTQGVTPYAYVGPNALLSIILALGFITIGVSGLRGKS